MNQCPVHSWACVCVWDHVCVYVKKRVCQHAFVYMCAMTSKLPAVKGLPCVQNHLTWADASLKPCHTRSFLCQTPQPFSLSSSLAVFFIPSLFRISHMFYNDVQIQQGEKSISLSLFWPLLGSWVFLRLSVSPAGKLDHLGMWTLFRSFFFLFFLPFFLLWPDGGIPSSSH